jgi:hypothetical protein
MRHSHQDIARAVMASLETYLRAVGHDALGWYPDVNGDWQELDEQGWAHNRRKLLEWRAARLFLRDTPSGAGHYLFEYYGNSLDASDHRPDEVSAVSFWLPPEYLEEHGARRVRELALELAAPLPFASGHAGPAFNALSDLVGVSRALRPLSLRYPGMDVPALSTRSWRLGTRLAGVNWLNFLGPPVLGELGGTSGLRARLSSPDITVQDLEGGRALVTLGEWPEAGDTQQGHDLPLHRALARVLEPWLYHTAPGFGPLPAEDMPHWERRFLDENESSS